MKKSHRIETLFAKLAAAVVSDNPRRKLSFYLLSAALSLTSLVMTIVNIFTAEYLLMDATLAFCVLCALNIVLLYFTPIPEKAVYLCFGVEAIALILFFFISGIPNGFSAIWICLIPGFALLVFGVRTGSIFSLLALAIPVFLFWIPAGRNLLQFSYTETFMLRFPFVYLSFFVISLLIELVRRETQRQLEAAREQYRHLYRHDALTGLYNRYGICEFLDDAFREENKQRIAVILLDIDDFKCINDRYGHECGDAVLQAVAQVPLRVMCEHCRCCRWGGEEFLLIMQCTHDPAEVADQIRREIEKTPVEFRGENIHVTVSAGVCVAYKTAGVTLHDVLDTADAALYESKENGKNRVTVRVYDPKENPGRGVAEGR